MLYQLFATVVVLALSSCASGPQIDVPPPLKQEVLSPSPPVVDRSNSTPYTVKRGDNLELIASDLTANRENWNLIALFNNLNSSADLKAGQVIYIPRQLLVSRKTNASAPAKREKLVVAEPTTLPKTEKLSVVDPASAIVSLGTVGNELPVPAVKTVSSTLENKTPSSQEKKRAFKAKLIEDHDFVAKAKRIIAEELLDPESARFSGIFVTQYTNLEQGSTNKAVCGFVNGRNSFGGYAGKQPFYFSGAGNSGEIEPRLPSTRDLLYPIKKLGHEVWVSIQDNLCTVTE